jgi:hypothetical protein
LLVAEVAEQVLDHTQVVAVAQEVFLLAILQYQKTLL